MKIKSLFFCALLLVSTSLIAKSESVQLAYRLQEGDVYIYETDLQQKISMPIPGVPVPDLEVDSDLDFRSKVLEVDSQGNATLEMTYEQYIVKGTTPDGTVLFDTEDTSVENGPMTDFSDIIGKSIEVTLTPTGEITSIEGMEELQAIFPAQQQSPKPFEIASLTYPDHPISVGDTWNQLVVIESGLPVALEVTGVATLKKLTDQTAEIAVEYQLTEVELPIDLGEVVLTWFMEGEGNGKLTVNRHSGVVQTGLITMLVDGMCAIEPKESDSPIEPMSFPIHLEQRVSMQSKKIS